MNSRTTDMPSPKVLHIAPICAPLGACSLPAVWRGTLVVGFALLFAHFAKIEPAKANAAPAKSTQATALSSAASSASAAGANAEPRLDQYLYFKPSPVLSTPSQLSSAAPALAGRDLTGREIKSFTPALTDSRNRRTAGLSPRQDVTTKGQTRQASITFTPASTVAGSRSAGQRNVSLVLASEVGAPSALGLSTLRAAAQPTTLALSPSFFKEPTTAYAVNLGVGYRGFKIEAGVNQIATPTSALANGVDLGLSYQGKDWKTSLHVSSQDYRFEDITASLPNRIDAGRSMALELGGAYQITPRIALTGGMRYAVNAPGTTFGVSLREPRASAPTREAASIYLGTALDF
jgi:hypothetical protein